MRASSVQILVSQAHIHDLQSQPLDLGVHEESEDERIPVSASTSVFDLVT